MERTSKELAKQLSEMKWGESLSGLFITANEANELGKEFMKLETELTSLRQQIKVEMPEPDCGWLEWSGGECPVSDLTMVDVRYGDTVALNKPAVRYNWGRQKDMRNIVAYRIV
jgi:hypothetical protein